jgi:hypothetical protein
MAGKRTLWAVNVATTKCKQASDVYKGCAENDLEDRHIALVISRAPLAQATDAITHDRTEREERRRDPAQDRKCKAGA